MSIPYLQFMLLFQKSQNLKSEKSIYEKTTVLFMFVQVKHSKYR